jgi:hypothetical protein
MPALTGVIQGAEYVVKPDGTGDFPTIQKAIDAAFDGDEILLADGVFKGDGNMNIDFKGKAIILHSKNGHPELCIIDAEGVQWIPRRVFDFKTDESQDSVVKNITIMNGTTGET